MGLNKVAQKDFKEEYLPHSRKDQFFDILKNNRHEIFFIALLLILFAVPYFITFVVKGVLVLNASTTLTGDDLTTFVFWTEIFYRTSMIVTFPFLAIGLAGVLKIIRRLAWGEPVFFREDFAQGIKENYKHFLLISIIFPILYLTEYASIYFYNESFVGFITAGINILVLFPVLLTHLYVTTYYKNKYRKNVVLSFEVYTNSFLRTLLNVISLFALTFLRMLNMGIGIQVIVMILILFLYLPLWLIATYLNEISIFDKLINEQHYPDIAYRGLRLAKIKQDKKKGSK